MENNILNNVNQRRYIGETTIDGEQINFYMENSDFVYESSKFSSTVPDFSIEEIDGKKFTHIEMKGETRLVEIPDSIIKARDQIRSDNKLNQNSIGSAETSHGKVYFSICESGKITAKINEKAVETDRIFNIEGRRAVFVADLGFVVVPETVEKSYHEFKRKQASRGLCLLYAGQSLLTGKDYYNFSSEISEAVYNRVQKYVEFFDEESDDSTLDGLHGWLTSNPERVEEVLRIRNPIASRQGEIDNQKAEAANANIKLIKKLTAKKQF